MLFKNRENGEIKIKSKVKGKPCTLKITEFLSKRIRINGLWVHVAIVKHTMDTESFAYFKGSHDLIQTLLDPSEMLCQRSKDI